MSPLVVVVIVVLAIAVVAALVLALRRREAKPTGPDIGAEIKAMVPNLGVQWTEIYERLNPTGDPQVKRLLDDFRNSGYQFNAHLGLKVLAASCDAIAARAGGGAAARFTIQDVLAEAMKQHQRVAGRWQ